MKSTPSKLQAGVLLPAELFCRNGYEAAEFCLRIAQNEYGARRLWIVHDGNGTTRIPPAFLKSLSPDWSIEELWLNNKVWPMDVGNNRYLALPLNAYTSLRDKLADVDTLIAPAYRGVNYFWALLKQAQVKPHIPTLVTTVYLPKTLQIRGELVLPLSYSDVVDHDLESRSLQLSDHIWVTHSGLIEELKKVYDLSPAQHIKADVRSNAAPTRSENKSSELVLAFRGDPTHTYGFDVFCELVEKFQHRIARVILSTQQPLSETRLGKRSMKQLQASGVEIQFVEFGKFSDTLEGHEIIIAPMRCPVFPASVRLGHDKGCQALWSAGFESDQNVGFIPADIRHYIRNLLKLTSENFSDDLQLPASLKRPLKDKTPQIGDKKTLKKVNSLSVVLVHYNRGDIVKDTLSSLAAQSHSDFELIFVDDGSDEDAFLKAKAHLESFNFKNARVERILNSYPSAARNHGAAMARGDALFFIDDDNLIAPNTLEDFMRALKKTEIVLSFYQTFEGSAPSIIDRDSNNNSGIVYNGPVYAFAGLIPGAGYFHNIMGNASFMMRRADFQKFGGFSEKYGIGLEDYEFLRRIGNDKEISFSVLPEPYLYFRLSRGRIRHGHIDWTSSVRLQAGHWRLFDQTPTNIPAFAAAYARQLHEVTQYHFIPQRRPKYFRMRSIFLHQYLRPFLSKQGLLRKIVTGFTGSESRIAKAIERRLFK